MFFPPIHCHLEIFSTQIRGRSNHQHFYGVLPILSLPSFQSNFPSNFLELFKNAATFHLTIYYSCLWSMVYSPHINNSNYMKHKISDAPHYSWTYLTILLLCITASKHLHTSIVRGLIMCLSIYLPIHPSIHPFIIHLFIHLSIHPSIHLSSYLSIYLAIYLSIYLSIYIYIHVYLHITMTISITLTIRTMNISTTD